MVARSLPTGPRGFWKDLRICGSALFVVGSEKLWSMIAAVTSRLCCRLFHPCHLGFSTRDSQQPQHSPGCSERGSSVVVPVVVAFLLKTKHATASFLVSFEYKAY